MTRLKKNRPAGTRVSPIRSFFSADPRTGSGRTGDRRGGGKGGEAGGRPGEPERGAHVGRPGKPAGRSVTRHTPEVTQQDPEAVEEMRDGAAPHASDPAGRDDDWRPERREGGQSRPATPRNREEPDWRSEDCGDRNQGDPSVQPPGPGKPAKPPSSNKQGALSKSHQPRSGSQTGLTNGRGNKTSAGLGERGASGLSTPTSSNKRGFQRAQENREEGVSTPSRKPYH